jgi:geranylgeranyl diphosphate synthase type II
MTSHHALIENRIAAWTQALPPGNLYAPMRYLMGLPGKRIRPALTLMACELFGGRAEDALDEALGIEVFHNFTLMHDDIMDDSPTRRGQPTVHVKWNIATAILSGDAMLVQAHQLMARDPRIAALFAMYALRVCEGQQLDMDNERRTVVKLAEYQEMIRLKTAVLLSCALQVGAMKAGATDAQCALIGRFGEELGLAFQVKDDLLDAFGDPAITGKQRGGDLRAGKRTSLLIRALEWSDAHGDGTLRHELSRPAQERDVDAILAVIERSGARQATEEAFNAHHAEAMKALAAVDVPDARKHALRALATALLERRA